MAILKFRHRNNIHTIRLFKLMHLITSSRYSSRVKSAKQFHFSGTYFGCVLNRLRDSPNGLVLHQLLRKKLLRCVRQRPGERGLAAHTSGVSWMVAEGWTAESRNYRSTGTGLIAACAARWAARAAAARSVVS